MTTPSQAADRQSDVRCPTCKQPMRRIEGKMGPFWGCSGFPGCKTTLNDVDGKPSTEIDESYRCPLCTRRMVRADAEKGDYWLCSGYAKGCSVTLKDIGGQPEAAFKCPECGSLLVKRHGKNGEFWGCTGYPNCTETFNNVDEKPDFDFFPPKRP